MSPCCFKVEVGFSLIAFLEEKRIKWDDRFIVDVH